MLIADDEPCQYSQGVSGVAAESAYPTPFVILKLFHLQLMTLAAVIWWAAPAFSQDIRINEILAANNTIFPDNVDFDDYSDWIELHNITSSPVELSSYFLTDDLEQPLKWKIPEGASIAANGYFIARADGFDAAPGQSYTREFAPWDSFQTRRFHASFKLGGAGETIGLYRMNSPVQSNSLLPLGSVWKYLDKGTDPGAGWTDPDFDDHAWLSGAAKLGYGEGDEATVVSYGLSSSRKYATTHFRIDVLSSGDYRLIRNGFAVTGITW